MYARHTATLTVRGVALRHGAGEAGTRARAGAWVPRDVIYQAPWSSSSLVLLTHASGGVWETTKAIRIPLSATLVQRNNRVQARNTLIMRLYPSNSMAKVPCCCLSLHISLHYKPTTLPC